MKKIYNKLVRDKIPEIIEANGSSLKMRIIKDDKEYLNSLLNKLIEETEEVIKDPSIEELADTLEVILSIGKELGYSPKQIEEARIKKAKERGSFNKRIFLINTE